MTNHRSSNNYYHQGRATKANSLSLKKSDKQREVKSREAKYCKNFLRRAVQDVNFNFCSKSVHKNHRLNGAYPSMYSTHIHTHAYVHECVCVCVSTYLISVIYFDCYFRLLPLFWLFEWFLFELFLAFPISLFLLFSAIACELGGSGSVAAAVESFA